MNKQEKPLISVIISFLNEEVFLSEAVESVINQEYSNWELILVDDGSSDNSTQIAKDYAYRYQGNIKYTEHKEHINKGLSASRNQGISIAKGELIAFLDADDIWFPDKLNVQVTLMSENPKAAMLCEACEYWYSWNDKTKQDITVEIGEVGDKSLKKSDKIFNPPALAEMLYPLAKGTAPTPSGIMARKSVLEKHSGFEEQFTGMYEDQAFLLKIYLNESVYVSSLCHHRYRQRKESICHTVNSQGKYHVWRQFFLEWLQQYMRQNYISHKKTWKLLNRALEPYHMSAYRHMKNRFSSVYRQFKKMVSIS